MKFFSQLNTTRQGEFLIALEAILWGLFPVITTLSLNSVGPIHSAAYSLFASLFLFIPVVTWKRSWHLLLVKAAWPYMLGTTLLLGVWFYLLVYIGTSLSNPGNVSILLLLEVFATTIILHFWGKETLKKHELIGSVLIVCSSAIVLFPGKFELNTGDLLVALSVAIAPVGNHCSKRARSYVTAPVLLTVRNFISACILYCIAWIWEQPPTAEMLNSALPILALNGILILGISKVLWVEGIFRITIGKAIAISSLFPIVTLVANYGLLGTPPSGWQIAALIPAISGVLLVTKRDSSPSSLS